LEYPEKSKQNGDDVVGLNELSKDECIEDERAEY
jgi:hypothetical protein